MSASASLAARQARPVAAGAEALPHALLNLAFVFSIFCYLRVFPFSSAEIQPLGAIFAALYLLLAPRQLSPAFLVYAACISVYALLGLANGVTASFETYLAVLAPVTICVALRGKLHLLSPRLFLASLYLWFLVGASQSFFPGLQQALGLDGLLETAIARYSATPLAEAGGRGATLLAPEPSYSAHTIFLFFVFAMLFYRRGDISRRSFLCALAAIGAMSVFNRSGTVAFIFMATLGGWLLLCLLRGKVRRAGLLASALVLVLGLPYLLLDWTQFRFMEVGAAFASALSSGGMDAFASQFVSIRAVSVNVAYSSLLEGNILGHGLGSWSQTFLHYLDATGVGAEPVAWFLHVGEESNVKPYAHAALLALDAGVVGLLLEAMLLWHVVGGARGLSRAWSDELSFTIVAFSLFSIVLHTPVSLPVYWLTLLAGLAMTSRRAAR
jgi:hypothetical protein